jgi:N-acetylmuramoyl-L-alanine amidase
LGLSSTRPTLPGHNGSHQVKWHSRGAAANYGQAGEFAAFGCDEVQGNSIGHNYGMLHTVPLDKATDKANVQNLVFGEVEAGANGQEGPKVKTNVNEDYFIFDPTSDDPQRQQPQFQFKIEDQGDPHQYKWTIYIQPTAKPVAGSSVPSMAYLQGTTTGPQVVEVSWNGQAYNGTGPLMPRGAYTFDIYIEEVRNLGDSTKIDAAELKTPYCIDFSEHSVEFTDATTEDADDATNPDTTEDEDDDNDPLQARITYKLSDCANANAQKVTVHLLDHDLNLKAAHNGGTLVNHRYENVSIYDFDGNETDGVWRGIFMAVDKHGDNTRDHQNRHCWAVNKLKVRSPLYVMIDPGHGRYRTENGTLGWRRPEVGGIHEDDLTLGFARVLRTQLSQGKNKSMFIVRQIRDDVDDIDNDVERSWELRWQITESWYAQVASKLDLMTSIYGYEVKPHMVMTSIHTNGSETSPTAHGTETYYKSRDNLPALTSAGRLLSEKIHSRLVNQAGRASRDAPITNYAIFRGPNPHIPYMLTEVAFHTNTQPWAEGVIPENDLLRHNFSWTPGFAAQGGNVSFLTGQPGCSEYLCPKWWGYSTAMPAMANGVKDYYKAQKNAP